MKRILLFISVEKNYNYRRARAPHGVGNSVPLPRPITSPPEWSRGFLCVIINVKLLLCAFIVYVRPMLEYNSVTWSPHLKCDIERIEKVQRQFTKRLCGFICTCDSEQMNE